MSWSAADIPPQSGRVAVVTGANAGLGLETARALARAGATVVMTARDVAKGQSVRESISRHIPHASLELVELDLSSLGSVKRAADEILARHDQVDILVNNAGVMAVPERQTDDGFELQLGVNHLGHFALTSLLLPGLVPAGAARVVTVTSYAHHIGKSVDAQNPHLHGNYSTWGAYSQSKLANYHFGLGLHRLFTVTRVRAASLLAHPGLSHTNLQTRSVEASGGWSQRFWQVLAARVGMAPATGALPQLRAATDPALSSGDFIAPRYFTAGPPVKRPTLRPGSDEAIRQLWEVSQAETGLRLDADSVRAAGRD